MHARTGTVVVQIPKWAQPLRLVPRTPIMLPIRNAGTIPLTLTLSFEYSLRSASEPNPLFEASVPSITLPVGGVEKVEISFLPNGTSISFPTPSHFFLRIVLICFFLQDLLRHKLPLFSYGVVEFCIVSN